MGKNQRLVIFIVIGAFTLSILGSAVLIFLGNDTSVSTSTDSELTSEQLQEIEQQLAEQAAQQEQIDAARASCGPLPTDADASPITPPEFELPSGDVAELGITDLTEGSGTEAQAGDCIVAHYHGVLTDGTVFDSSFERGQPNRFSLLQVIEGWQEGIPGMKEGGVRVLTIPSELAYGEAGAAPIIGPNADLVFVVELVEVVEL